LLPPSAFVPILLANCFFQAVLTGFAVVLIYVVFKAPVVNDPNVFYPTVAPNTQFTNPVYPEKTQISSYV